jgi:autotransporter-associated beta strand protein
MAGPCRQAHKPGPEQCGQPRLRWADRERRQCPDAERQHHRQRRLTKSGAGNLILSGNNSYQGGTNLTTGTLVVGSNTALGAATSILNAAAGTTLDTNTAGLSVSNAISVAGTPEPDRQQCADPGRQHHRRRWPDQGRRQQPDPERQQRLHGQYQPQCRHPGGWQQHCAGCGREHSMPQPAPPWMPLRR